MYLKNAIQLYLTFNYTLAPKTRQTYQQHLTRLQIALQDPLLTEINHHAIAKFMAGLHKKNGQPYHPGYLHQIHRTLHTFFVFCVDEGWLAMHPMARLKRPRLEKGPKPRLSLAQVRQLLNAITETDLAERNMAIVLLMLDCGLRKGEVVALTMGDVDLEAKRILVHASKTCQRRDVPLSNMAATALTRYLLIRPKYKLLTEPVFVTGSGPRKGEPIGNKVIEELMKRLKKRLGIPLYAHLLRHTFGNHYIRKGGLRHLQKILGHSRIDTTAGFYTDPDFEDLQAEIVVAAPTAQLK